MSEKEEKQKLPTAILAILFLLFALRPEEGYLQRLDFLIFLIAKGLLLENIFLFEKEINLCEF